MSTLEEAGYVQSPFTTTDIWGNPSPFNMVQEQKTQLNQGYDNSALPGLADAQLQQDVIQGSSTRKHKNETRMQFNQQNEMVKLGVLAAVLAAAFFWSRS